VIVGFVLFALIVTMLTFGMRAASKSAAAADEMIERATELRIAQGVIRARLAEAYPLFVNRPRERARVGFDGTADTVEFISFVPNDIGMGGLQRIQLGLASAAPGQSGDLVLTQQPVALTADGVVPLGTAERRVILGDVRRLRLRYFGAPANQPTNAGPAHVLGVGPIDRGEVSWRNEWGDNDVLPMLVSLGVEFRPADRRSWPEIVVAPSSNATSDCVLQPTTRKCRPR